MPLSLLALGLPVTAARFARVLHVVWPELPDARARELFDAAAAGGGALDEAAFCAWAAREDVAAHLPLFRERFLGRGGDLLGVPPRAPRAAA